MHDLFNQYFTYYCIFMIRNCLHLSIEMPHNILTVDIIKFVFLDVIVPLLL